jgi:hypothetical protein
MAALLLALLWQPAVTTTELKPQQDIILFLLDDSRSMAAREDGSTRQAQAVKALQGGALAAVEKKFQTRLYRFDSRLTRISDLKELQTAAPATHIGDSLKQLVNDTSDLPIGAIVLLSDGADNSGTIDPDTISALRTRHIPSTLSVSAANLAHDVEIDEAASGPALADSRRPLSFAFISGYADASQAQRPRRSQRPGVPEVGIRAGRRHPVRDAPLQRGRGRSQALQFSVEMSPGEENAANNASRAW